MLLFADGLGCGWERDEVVVVEAIMILGGKLGCSVSITVKKRYINIKFLMIWSKPFSNQFNVI